MDRKRDSFFLTNKKEQQPRMEGKSKFKTTKQEPSGKTPELSNGNKAFKDKSKHKFDENRSGLKDDDKDSKKPFDKKTYRLKKYSKKYKLEQWEDQRKKRLLRTYYKEIQHDTAATGSYKPVNFDEDLTDGTQEGGRFVKHPDLIEKEKLEAEKVTFKTKKDPFWKAKEQFEKIKQEKLLKKQEIEKIKEEKQKKLQEYKKKKQERFKKLSKKTRKGQPVMTGRMELLLEKIQKG